MKPKRDKEAGGVNTTGRPASDWADETGDDIEILPFASSDKQMSDFNFGRYDKKYRVERRRENLVSSL